VDHGRLTFEKLKWMENGSLGSQYWGSQNDSENNEVIIEPFDAPLVAINIFVENKILKAEFRYEYIQTFDLKSLCLDDYDRFHGLTESGIPFVCNRKAQAALFDLADDYDDESITLFGENIALPTYFVDEQKVEKEKFWCDRYQNQETGWDLNQPSPILVNMFPRMKVPPSRVLVLGCGRGHDAVYFAKQGHFVTAVDISPKALEEAQKLYGSTYPNIRWVQADIFNLPRDWDQSFDLIWEHTCFCAINPTRRNELVGIWRRLLSEHGQLLAIFFVMEKRGGPAFGASEWELRQRLQKNFRFLYWGRWRQLYSHPHSSEAVKVTESFSQSRLGKELFVLANKKSFTSSL
jgi:SAM-dependent methyltransferase